MRVVIQQLEKSPMQSGKATAGQWLLRFEQEQDSQFIEPLMGWTGSSDMTQEVRLMFPTRDAAIKFASDEGYEYRVIESRGRKTILRSYQENFTRPPE